MKRFVVALMFLCGIAYATPTTSINIPNNFTPNTTIQSSQVNSNFTECQNQYNAHTHTDITSLGAVTSGSWLGSPVGTTYGGTGNNWGGVSQGSVIYFNGAGTMTTLAPGTNGQTLTTSGAGANPTWTSGGSARNAITSGFEASASVGNLNILVYGGSLFHNNTGVAVATTTTLTLATASDWSSGAVVSYGGGAGWNYVGVSSDASTTNKGVFFLGNNPPTASDVNGNSSGTNLYSYDGTRWYRVIYAFRVNTSDRVALTQNQRGRKVVYDEGGSESTSQQVLNAGASATFAAVDSSTYVPSISTMASYAWDVAAGTFNLGTNSTLTYGCEEWTQNSQRGTAYDVPLTGQTVYYKTGANLNLNVRDYTLNIR